MSTRERPSPEHAVDRKKTHMIFYALAEGIALGTLLGFAIGLSYARR